jgi:sulfur carrier protein
MANITTPILPVPASPDSGSLEILVNGDLCTCAISSLSQCLEQLGFNPQLVAVEYNGEIVPRHSWSATPIQAGDRLEVVTIVGGG